VHPSRSTRHQLLITATASIFQDQFDCFDFTDNEIKKLENFPKFLRLKTVLLSNNHVSGIQKDLAGSIPNLETLILTNCKMDKLTDLDNLACLKNLNMLCLLRNNVTRKQQYRYYVIHTLPQLSVLDFQKIKKQEREEAAKLFTSKLGQSLVENDRAEPSKTYIAGQGMVASQISDQTTLSQKQIAQIKVSSRDIC